MIIKINRSKNYNGKRPKKMNLKKKVLYIYKYNRSINKLQLIFTIYKI